MNSDLKRHNPFALPSEPDFTNEIGVKWWGINAGRAEDGTAVYVEAPDGDRDYLILKDGEVLYGTKSLEALFYRFTVLEHLRKLEATT
ncbi:hypothetical protein [Gordonia terrae]|uniref:hypothetical protein n=1 Tax=Gordonia terrae TaxID=2055 RepID=UPI001267A253|nr:hypothetical protein [Gordonia terrae]